MQRQERQSLKEVIPPSPWIVLKKHVNDRGLAPVTTPEYADPFCVEQITRAADGALASVMLRVDNLGLVEQNVLMIHAELFHGFQSVPLPTQVLPIIAPLSHSSVEFLLTDVPAPPEPEDRLYGILFKAFSLTSPVPSLVGRDSADRPWHWYARHSRFGAWLCMPAKV